MSHADQQSQPSQRKLAGSMGRASGNFLPVHSRDPVSLSFPIAPATLKGYLSYRTKVHICFDTISPYVKNQLLNKCMLFSLQPKLHSWMGVLNLRCKTWQCPADSASQKKTRTCWSKNGLGVIFNSELHHLGVGQNEAGDHSGFSPGAPCTRTPFWAPLFDPQPLIFTKKRLGKLRVDCFRFLSSRQPLRIDRRRSWMPLRRRGLSLVASDFRWALGRGESEGFSNNFLGADSTFCSTIVLFEHKICFVRVSVGFL